MEATAPQLRLAILSEGGTSPSPPQGVAAGLNSMHAMPPQIEDDAAFLHWVVKRRSPSPDWMEDMLKNPPHRQKRFSGDVSTAASSGSDASAPSRSSSARPTSQTSKENIAPRAIAADPKPNAAVGTAALTKSHSQMAVPRTATVQPKSQLVSKPQTVRTAQIVPTTQRVRSAGITAPSASEVDRDPAHPPGPLEVALQHDQSYSSSDEEDEDDFADRGWDEPLPSADEVTHLIQKRFKVSERNKIDIE